MKRLPRRDANSERDAQPEERRVRSELDEQRRDQHDDGGAERDDAGRGRVFAPRVAKVPEEVAGEDVGDDEGEREE